MFRDTDMPELGDAEPTDAAALAKLLEEGAFWVAELDETPVGFLAAGTRDGQYVILQLSVARAAQGQGIGAGLMRTALAHGRERGAADAVLTTFRDIPWNAPWYARFGFVEIAAADMSEVVRRMQAHEAANGLDMTRRCAMRVQLS